MTPRWTSGASRPSFSVPSWQRPWRYLDQQGAAAIGIDVLIPQTLTTMPALQAGGEGDATTMGLAIEQSRKVVLPEWQVAGQLVRPLFQWQMKVLADPEPLGTDFGMVNLTEDSDQFVRRQQLAIRTDADAVSYQFGLRSRPRLASRRSPGILNAASYRSPAS